MAILDELRHDRGLAMIFITHDLDLAAAVTDRLAVMYAGVIVETGPSSTMQSDAKHPYTAALHASRPSTVAKSEPLAIPGRPIAAWEFGDGCPFEPRVRFRRRHLSARGAEATRMIESHWVACHRVEEIAENLTLERNGTTVRTCRPSYRPAACLTGFAMGPIWSHLQVFPSRSNLAARWQSSDSPVPARRHAHASSRALSDNDRARLSLRVDQQSLRPRTRKRTQAASATGADGLSGPVLIIGPAPVGSRCRPGSRCGT